MSTTNCNHFYGIASPITTGHPAQWPGSNQPFTVPLSLKLWLWRLCIAEGCDSCEKEFQGLDCTRPARTDVTPKSACASMLLFVGEFNSNNIVWQYWFPLSLFALWKITRRQFWLFSAHLRDSKWINVTILHLLPTTSTFFVPLLFSVCHRLLISHLFNSYCLVRSRIAVFGEFSVSSYISSFPNWFRFVRGLLNLKVAICSFWVSLSINI